MKYLHKLAPVLLAVTVLAGSLVLVHTSPAVAAEGTSTVPAQTDPAMDFDNAPCASVDNCNLVTKYVNPLIRFLSAVVGLAVVIGIIWGAIEYSSSGGDPQKVAHAKEKIRNALIALVAFIFLFALMQWLIPGGVV